jgi:hypothetical protein
MGTRLCLATAATLALLAAGCGTSDSRRDARAVVERFGSAVERKDGRAACEELSEDAASQLEKSEGEPCEKAVLTLKLSPGAPTRVEVYVTSAEVVRAGGEAAFLDQTPEGWRISAAGCKPQGPDMPYDCELEA